MPWMPIAKSRVGVGYQTALPLSSPGHMCGAQFMGVPDGISMNNSSEDEGDLRVASEELPIMNFDIMLTYSTHCFPKAKGHQEKVNRLEPPRENRPVEDTRKVRLTLAKPIQFSLDKADKALLCSNNFSDPHLPTT